MYISEPCKGNQATTRLLTPWQPSLGGVMALSKYPVNDPWRVTWLLHSGYSGERSISKASLHADHPPKCLKMLCKCTIIQYCNASLCKKVRHYFSRYFVLFTFNSKRSFLFYNVNLPKGEVLVNVCFYINWLRPSDAHMRRKSNHHWFR